MVKTVVILGGAYAGVHIAHYLLKKDLDIKVILVSKNSHFYWNIASVRAIVPGILKDEQLLQPLEAALKHYPAERWEVVVGSAERADFGAKTVAVMTAGRATRTLAYDQLVLATGSRCATPDVPWKSLDTYEATVARLHDLAARAQAAQHIVVAGGGSTGVELAGELAFEWGKTKEVVLLNSGDSLMGGDSVGVGAAAELRKLGVTIRTGATVEQVVPATTRADGKTEVLLKGGDVILTDLYLPTMGLVPNSEYVDAQYLTERGTVKVDDCLRVQGLTDVWAAGDIVSKPRAGFMITQKQAAGVGKNIELVLRGKDPVAVKPMPFDILACAVGRSRGVGRAGSIKLFSIMVWLSKGRTLAVERLAGYMDGNVA